eukprot:gene3118-13131_t
MSNQRLSVVYGIVLAAELGRIPVIPGFILSGVQWSTKDIAANDKSVHMEELYDVDYFKLMLDSVGMEVLDSRDAPPISAYTFVDMNSLQGDLVEALHVHRSVNHMSIGCTLFKLDGLYFSGRNNRILWTALNAMRPNKNIEKTVTAITKKLKSESPNKRFTFVHLRIEDDWVLHCIRWSHIPDGVIRNNCYNNTDTIDLVLEGLNVKNTDPVYVASFWDHVDSGTEKAIMKRLADAGYKVFTSRNFKKVASRDRETNAMVDYEIKYESIYSSFSSVQSDFVRMDLPLLPELEQHMYVLYTQPDVFFNKKVTVSSFSIPLPEVIGMVADPSSPSGVDGSVSLINLPKARKTYTLFKDFVLNHTDCPRFDKGPGVVGAYYEFYGDSVTNDLMEKEFAAKPTNPVELAANVVHFNGPKPHEYWDYVQSGVCPAHLDPNV